MNSLLNMRYIMKKFHYASFLFLALFVISCATSKTYLNPKYRGEKINNAFLAMAPVENFALVDENIFAEDLDIKVSVDSVKSIFCKTLTSLLINKSSFSKVYEIKFNEGVEFQERELQFNEDTFKFNIPTKQIKHTAEGEVFLLLVDDVNFVFHRKQQDNYPSRSYTASGADMNDLKYHSLKEYDYYITLNITYCIIDNSSLEVVSYGKLKDQIKYVIPKSVDKILTEEITEIAMGILEKTPFEDNR